MDVIRHNHEFVKEKSLLIPVMREGVDQTFGSCLAAQNWKARRGDSRDEKDAVRIHVAMVASCGGSRR